MNYNYFIELLKNSNKLPNYEAKHWTNIPDVIIKMKVRGERSELNAIANYARFYISQIFPHLKKFIYIDNDVIALKGIKMYSYKYHMLHIFNNLHV